MPRQAHAPESKQPKKGTDHDAADYLARAGDIIAEILTYVMIASAQEDTTELERIRPAVLNSLLQWHALRTEVYDSRQHLEARRPSDLPVL